MYIFIKEKAHLFAQNFRFYTGFSSLYDVVVDEYIMTEKNDLVLQCMKNNIGIFKSKKKLIKATPIPCKMKSLNFIDGDA